MKFSELLPIGSVVLLNNAQKKIVIIGLRPIQHLESGEDIAYDYIGVPYPEGYIGTESAMLFMHKSIKEIIFTGYSDDERTILVEAVQELVDKADETIRNQKNN